MMWLVLITVVFIWPLASRARSLNKLISYQLISYRLQVSLTLSLHVSLSFSFFIPVFQFQSPASMAGTCTCKMQGVSVHVRCKCKLRVSVSLSLLQKIRKMEMEKWFASKMFHPDFYEQNDKIIYCELKLTLGCKLL